MIAVLAIGPAQALAAGDGAAESTGESAYLRLPPFAATLFDGDKPVGILSAIILLEVAGDHQREAVLENMPKLEDAFVHALHQLADAEGRLQGEYGPIEIKQAFQLVANHVLGEGVVEEVLIEGISRSRNK